MDESFEIHVRNHKKEAVNVRVVEHLYRWTNWKLTAQSHEWRKKDAQTIEFPVTIAPNGEQVVTYTVHYSWRGGASGKKVGKGGGCSTPYFTSGKSRSNKTQRTAITANTSTLPSGPTVPPVSQREP